MPTNLKGRSILTLDDLTAAEIRFLLRLAAELKSAKFSGSERQRLKGKNIALIFEKDSTRTRTGFEVAAYDQGAHVTYLGPSGSQIGHKESMKDTARVLGRMYDAIEFRGYSQRSARELAQFAGVPVYNGLTDEAHPARTHPSRKAALAHAAVGAASGQGGSCGAGQQDGPHRLGGVGKRRDLPSAGACGERLKGLAMKG